MTDITRNIFYWFRGPSFEGAPAPHRQLENNLTKSLVNVLEHCDRQLVLKPFLNRLGLQICQDVVFSLQRRPALAGKTKKRIVLGIVGGEGEAIPGESTTEKGRPDAWICGSGWTVLIESKIGPKIPKRQLDDHARAVGWPKKTYDIHMLSWQDLHRIARDARRKVSKKDRVSQLLLSDWQSYLEHQNMDEFEKLEPLDFDFFNLPVEERRALLPHMKSRVRAFAAMLAKSEPAKKIADLYSESSVRDWKFGEPDATGQGYWFNIGGAPSSREWHATVFFRADGLEIAILNSSNGLARKLCRSGVDVFSAIIELASKGKDLCVGCHRAWYRHPESSYKGQRIGHRDDALIIKPESLDASSRGTCAAIVEATIEQLLRGKKWRTELRVLQNIPRDDLLGISAKRQVALVARPLKHLHRSLSILMNRESDRGR